MLEGCDIVYITACTVMTQNREVAYRGTEPMISLAGHPDREKRVSFVLLFSDKAVVVFDSLAARLSNRPMTIEGASEYAKRHCTELKLGRAVLATAMFHVYPDNTGEFAIKVDSHTHHADLRDALLV